MGGTNDIDALRVVVGVDASEASRKALRWAALYEEGPFGKGCSL